MSDIPQSHRQSAPQTVRCAAITISDTRTPETDSGGRTLVELLKEAGHQVLHQEIIADEPAPMRALLEELCNRSDIDAILLTGGTGLGSRDQTYETISAMLSKPLPGYGEVFRMLSYDEIGAAAMLSRATGGLVGQTVVLSMPGSPAAVRLAMQKIILPELSHLVREATR